MSEVIEQIKSIGEDLKSNNAELKQSIETVTVSVKNASDEIELLKAAQEKSISKEQFEKEIDRLEKASAKHAITGEPKSFGESLKEALNEKAATLSEMSKAQGGAIDLNLKDITAASFTLTGTAVNPSRTTTHAGMYASLDNPHIRNYINVGTADGAAVYYTEEGVWSANAGYQAGEGAAKPKVDVTFATKIAPVVTIAAILKVSRQALDDVKFLQSYIAANAPEKLLRFEDQELLYGAGTANTINGLMTATTQTATGTTLYDKLLNAFKTLATGINGTFANRAFINAGDYYDALGLKGTDGHYLFPQAMWNGSNIMVAGVPVVPIMAMGAGDLITGDFATGCQLFIREALNVRFFEQNVDDVEKNMVTVRVEERIAFPIYKPTAFVKVDTV